MWICEHPLLARAEAPRTVGAAAGTVRSVGTPQDVLHGLHRIPPHSVHNLPPTFQHPLEALNGRAKRWVLLHAFVDDMHSVNHS